MNPKRVYSLITMFNFKPMINSRLIILRNEIKLRSTQEKKIRLIKIQAFKKIVKCYGRNQDKI